MKEKEKELVKNVRVSTKNESENWPSYLQKLKEEAPIRIEEAAKFLFGVVSLSLAIFTNSVLSTKIKPWLLLIIITLWCLSIVLSLYVLFPFRYKVFSHSAESIEATLNKVTNLKYRLLQFSIVFYILSLLTTIIFHFFILK